MPCVRDIVTLTQLNDNLKFSRAACTQLTHSDYMISISASNEDSLFVCQFYIRIMFVNVPSINVIKKVIFVSPVDSIRIILRGLRH